MGDERGAVAAQRDGHALPITVDRAAKMNGFTPEMFDRLEDAMGELDRNADLWVGVIAFAGKHATAGLDMPRFFGPSAQRGARRGGEDDGRCSSASCRKWCRRASKWPGRARSRRKSASARRSQRARSSAPPSSICKRANEPPAMKSPTCGRTRSTRPMPRRAWRRSSNAARRCSRGADGQGAAAGIASGRPRCRRAFALQRCTRTGRSRMP